MARFTKGEWVDGVVHWVEGEVAMISVVFTWRLPEARRLAEYYHSLGHQVRIGGPGVFTKKAQDFICELAQVGGDSPDAVARHNPMATFASRGCPVGCWFCIVPPMEGTTFTELPDFPVRPVLCDNNLSALSPAYQDHIVGRYLAAGVPLLDANSGFEPATFDDEVFRRWKPVLKGPWRFAFDEATEGADVERVFRMLADVSPRRKQVYTMIGHEPFDVCMERIRRVIAWGGEPYAQPFMKLNTLVKKPDPRHDWTEEKLRKVQRWVNWRAWKVVPFEQYDASVKSPRPQVVGWTDTLFEGQPA